MKQQMNWRKQKISTVHVMPLIQKYMKEYQRIIFNGNGYSDEWVEEAARRGLPNIKSMVDAVETLTTDKAVALFEKFGIFTRKELESREEVLYEQYSKVINIEALTMIDMATKQYIPSVIKYTKDLADTVLAVKEAGADTSVQSEMLSEITVLLKDAKAALEKLKVSQAEGLKKEGREQAFFYKDTVMVDMNNLRTPVDKLEMLVDKDFWPVPSYGDLTFEV